MAEIRDTDWAYAAGFVDGEGCIAIVRGFVAKKGRFYYTVQVVVANRDRAVLEWMATLWNGNIVSVSARVGLAANCWNWRLGPREATPFLEGIRPWLRIKQAQCDNALAMMALLLRSHRTLGRNVLPHTWLHEQEELYWKQRELNHRGSGPFVRKAMHSPRKIHAARLSEPRVS